MKLLDTHEERAKGAEPTCNISRIYMTLYTIVGIPKNIFNIYQKTKLDVNIAATVSRTYCNLHVHDIHVS